MTLITCDTTTVEATCGVLRGLFTTAIINTNFHKGRSMEYLSFYYYLSLLSMALGGRNSGMFLPVNGSPVNEYNLHTLHPTLETAFLIYNCRSYQFDFNTPLLDATFSWYVHRFSEEGKPMLLKDVPMQVG